MNKYRYKNKTLEINIYKYKYVQNCYNCYSVKTLANKWVLSFFLNDSTAWSTFLIANGNEFHRAGAAEENAPSPKVLLDLDLGVHSNVPL